MEYPSTAALGDTLAMSESSTEEVVNQGEEIQHVQEGRLEGGEASFTYCGRALDDSAGKQVDSYVRVPITCFCIGTMLARCKLERVRIASGVSTPTRSLAARAARSDWMVTDPSTRQGWLGCP